MEHSWLAWNVKMDTNSITRILVLVSKTRNMTLLNHLILNPKESRSISLAQADIKMLVMSVWWILILSLLMVTNLPEQKLGNTAQHVKKVT